MRIFVILAVFGLCTATTLKEELVAQSGKTLESQKNPADPSSSDETDPFEKGVAETPVFDFTANSKPEREKFLKILSSEIVPNAIKADLDKLKANTMRLGSYRQDWVSQARDVLVSNSAMSELYLYQYTMSKNTRLTREILETLLSFPGLRYPRASLAFFSFFVLDRRELDRPVLLLEKAIDQDPTMAPDAIASLAGGLGEGIPLSSRLRLAVKACEKGQLPAASLDLIKQWRSQVQEYWERVLSAELEACVRGH